MSSATVGGAPSSCCGLIVDRDTGVFASGSDAAAKVGEPPAALPVAQDVGRLQVAVGEALGVDVLEGVRHFADRRHDGLPAGAAQRAEVAAIGQLQRHAHAVVRGDDGQRAEDARMDRAGASCAASASSPASKRGESRPRPARPATRSATSVPVAASVAAQTSALPPRPSRRCSRKRPASSAPASSCVMQSGWAPGSYGATGAASGSGAPLAPVVAAVSGGSGRAMPVSAE